MIFMVGYFLCQVSSEASPAALSHKYKRSSPMTRKYNSPRRLGSLISAAFSRYRKNISSERTSVCAKTHPLSLLARSADMFFLSMLTACSLVSPLDDTRQADRLAGAAGWRKQQLATPHFDLLSYVPDTQRPKRRVLTVYIEGDGRAWLSTHRISPNPTPRNPLALKLALRHPSDQAVAYLARPCQYGNRATLPPCRPEYWSVKRFAPEVIEASRTAVDRLKRRIGAERVVLVGYSGGGTVAALLAARRRDVAELITVDGNLDHRISSKHHSVSLLRGSLNPADEWRALRDIPQRHLVGRSDRIVPPLVARAYQRRFPEGRRPPVRVIAEFDHHCCWEEHWPRLLGYRAKGSKSLSNL